MRIHHTCQAVCIFSVEVTSTLQIKLRVLRRIAGSFSLYSIEFCFNVFTNQLFKKLVTHETASTMSFNRTTLNLLTNLEHFISFVNILQFKQAILKSKVTLYELFQMISAYVNVNQLQQIKTLFTSWPRSKQVRSDKNTIIFIKSQNTTEMKDCKRMTLF